MARTWRKSSEDRHRARRAQSRVSRHADLSMPIIAKASVKNDENKERVRKKVPVRPPGAPQSGTRDVAEASFPVPSSDVRLISLPSFRSDPLLPYSQSNRDNAPSQAEHAALGASS